MIHRIPSGTRDVLPDELRELRAITEGIREVFTGRGYGEVATPALEYESTLARGDAAAAEPAYRLFFVDKLVSMGARIILCDPHRAVVTGPSKLYGQRMSSPDIRAGMAMLIAGLCAEGVSTIGNIGEIDRGYERIDERLRALGARIERVENL